MAARKLNFSHFEQLSRYDAFNLDAIGWNVEKKNETSFGSNRTAAVGTAPTTFHLTAVAELLSTLALLSHFSFQLMLKPSTPTCDVMLALARDGRVAVEHMCVDICK